MPRLPTIRVIGSQAISVSSGVSVIVSPCLLVDSEQFGALRAPRRFFVDGLSRDGAQSADNAAVHAARRGLTPGTGRLVHERHELVREPAHGAGDADAADVRAAADAVDPAALGYVALDHRSPAAELDQALRRVVLARELTLLVVAGPVAALMN